MDKSFRIHTNISSDTVLSVNMQQDFDFLEVLSLKLKQKDAYRIHSSNYGIIVGRVLANDAFGIPNAKVSIFIERDTDDTTEMESIYPYTEVTSKDMKGRKYNLLPDDSDDECYRIIGTFPRKRLVLDDDVQLEIYDKYWKYTTVTNNSGDYMLYGVPSGTVTLHVDLDLSDIGVLSQRPRDFEYKGYNVTMFDSPNQFKESTNLDGLAQVFSQNKSVYVYPFWGDSDNGIAAITRSDIEIQYKFEPTCVFMGSIVSDNEGHAIGHKCSPDVENGINSQLIGGSGTIEMIRKTTDGLIEEYQIQGNQLIDENGVWCYQIPMNLDYIGTDEYGNIVPTDNPSKGIPTRTQVRFRFSKNETNSEGFSRHTAKYLVPMNPIFSEEKGSVKIINRGVETCGTVPYIAENGSEIEKMYSFGSSTPLSCFRDLYWNNVYTVKNYIPKTQVAHRAYAKNYCALKGSNLADDQNPIPFNKLNINLPFLYMVVCIIYRIMIKIVKVVNKIISFLYWLVYKCCIKIFRWKICPFKPLRHLLGDLSCITMSAGGDEGNIAYYPGCSKSAMNDSSCPDDMLGSCRKSNDDKELMDKIQRNLALEFKIVRLDLYQDWINGCLYMPLWYWKKRKKKKFLGITISRAKNQFCSSDEPIYSRLKSIVTCSIGYKDTSFNVSNNKNSMPDNEKRWHKNKSGSVRYNRGLIKPVENRDGLTVYYYSALQATSDNVNPRLEMARRPKNFKAVRLFATDIVLLGNLDPNNIYGIPQFVECLPSTTANIPPIATIEEDSSDDEASNTSNNELEGENEDSGTTITTGMDWNHNGEKQKPKLKTGLFMDLECTYAATRPKSCINVERMSELGVSLDMTHRMPFSINGDLQYGDIENDGFISKYELDDMENRAMFATMNHVGFIPQEYQDMHNGYETQVRDVKTNYLIPKFKYIYPVDFDGRLQLPMQMYKNGFEQAMFDERDESYITFRLGAEKSDKASENEDGRIRHFYLHDNNVYSMPLYNNSFYFYFGIKKGSTAIDKFNTMFYAKCFKKAKLPFDIDLNHQGKSYCVEIYSDSGSVEDINGFKVYSENSNKNKAYGYIKFHSDNIKTPYSYKLLDGFGRTIIEEDGMTDDTFVIGGAVDDSGNTRCCSGGCICYQNDKGKCVMDGDNCVTLENQEYRLVVTDSYGKTIIQNVNLSVPYIDGTYTSKNLGTKFYNDDTTKMDYVCDRNNAFYGEIHMSSFSVDGYECKIKEVGKITNDGSFLLRISGESEDISDKVIADVKLSALNLDDDETTENCLCSGNGSPIATDFSVIEIDEETHDKEIIFNVYKPRTYSLRITQLCNNTYNGNSSEELITIKNGEPFMTSLNGMATKFMLGTTPSSNGNNFYSPNVVTDPTFDKISGWYGLHDEQTYMFTEESNRTYISNQDSWEDFLDGMMESIASPSVKRAILVHKFNAMFSLSEAAYVTQDSSKMFEFTSDGGVSPILYRSLAPTYENDTTIKTQYVLSDDNEVSCNEFYPNIVGDNYCPNPTSYTPGVSRGPEFNDRIYDNSDKLGNYFAAFTRDGSYIAKDKIDGLNISIERSPSFASISPIVGNRLKTRGKDDIGSISTYLLAYNADVQTLPNDKRRDTMPYLRAMFVDRRLDHDLLIMGPSMGSNFSLYAVDNSDMESYDKVWRGGRISGWTMNGIEMGYDENDDYNVISANVQSVSSNIDGETYYPKADYNYRLEYTFKHDSNHRCLACNYQGSDITGNTCPKCRGEVIAYQGEFGEQPSKTYGDEGDKFIMFGNVTNHDNDEYGGFRDDAITRYNSSSGDGVWNEGTFGYDPNIDDVNEQLVKRFYTAEIDGVDIRNFFWSDGNRRRLANYCTNQQGFGLGVIRNNSPLPYVYEYPALDAYKLGNGDFSKENYPTQRFIDIGNLPPVSVYHYEVESCSYAMQSYVEEDGKIVARTTSSDKVEFDINWVNPITMVPPNADTTDYVNIEYKLNSISTDGVALFNASGGNISFKYTPYTCEGYRVYTTIPKIIQVLPYINGMDGISYYKTVTPNGEISASGDIDNAIDRVTLDNGVFNMPFKNRWARMLGLSQNIFLPSNVEFVSGFEMSSGKIAQRIIQKGGDLVPGGFFKRDGEWLTSDDEDFTNILFQQKLDNLMNNGINVIAFSILVDREYLSEDDDHLVKHIRTIETSDIYDCRKLRMRIPPNSASTSDPLSYVMMNVSNEHKEDLITGVTATTSSTSTDIDVTTETTEEDFSTKVFTQVLSFDFLFNTGSSVSVVDRENETFASYDTMSYVFRFIDKNKQQYDISPSEITPITGNTESIIRMTVIWSADMGLIMDSQWNEMATCEIYVRTQSNFTYRLSGFKIEMISQSPSGSSAQDKKDGMEAGKKYETNLRLIRS